MEALKISIRSSRNIRIIGYDEIMCCMGDGRYTRIFLQNGQSHLIAKELNSYESLLPKDFFFRIHKSCIVNLAFVKSYSINDNHKIELNNHTILPVAKRRCKCFVNKLLEVYPQ